MVHQADANASAPRYCQKTTVNTRWLVPVVNDDQWNAATPCKDGDMKQLVNHMVSGVHNVESIMEGDGPQNFGDVQGDDATRALDAACKAATAA